MDRNEIKAALNRGDLAAAMEAARHALALTPGDIGIAYLLVLAAARSGATAWAEKLYRDYGLDTQTDTECRALGARLAKDRALGASGKERRQLAAAASHMYKAIYDDTGDPFPGINAATLAVLAGDNRTSQTLAAAILAHPSVATGREYWDLATRVEAHFILGQSDEALSVAAHAKTIAGADYGSVSSTLRNIRALLDAVDPTGEALTQFKTVMDIPNTVVFTGHMFTTIPDPQYKDENALKAVIASHLRDHNIRIGFGALACGADILMGEALIEQGGELHVILPFAEENFIAASVDIGGPQWRARYTALMAAASTVTYSSEEELTSDPLQFAFCAGYMEGMALLRSRQLGSDAYMMAVWDGAKATGPAGAGAQAIEWRRQGRALIHIPLSRPDSLGKSKSAPQPRGADRAMRAMLFTDFPKFTQLCESAIPYFLDTVMGRIADILKDQQRDILTQNTWGDAVHVVFESPSAAAKTASLINEAIAAIDFAPLGLKEPASMRIGIHYGPVFEGTDKITGRPNVYGAQVNEAARIEPITPPGAVYVTESFAAHLERNDDQDIYQCLYVGEVDLPKRYGKRRLYSVTAETYRPSSRASSPRRALMKMMTRSANGRQRPRRRLT